MNFLKRTPFFILLIGICMLMVNTISAQTPTNKIAVLTQTKNNKIQFRWFHSSAPTWQNANQYGYVITRKTLNSSNQVIATNIINIDGITGSDSTSAKWAPYFKVDSAAYYTLFRTTVGRYDATQTVQERMDEYKKDTTAPRLIPNHSVGTELFAYAFMASCEKYNAAKLAGLAYDDIDIQTQYKYEYKISTRVPANVMSIGDTTITINPNNFTVPIMPPKPKANVQAKLVFLSWNADSLKNTFYNYYVQRKEAGKGSFVQLNEYGLLNAADSTNQLVFRDSIPNKTKRYVYRIVGKTYFDDFIVSDSIFVENKQYLELQIGLDSVRRVGNLIKANWQVQKQTSDPLNTIIKYYYFSVSNNESSNFNILQNNISLNNTSLQIPFSAVSAVVDTSKSMYYKITAIGIENDEISSPAYLVFSKKNTSRPSKPQNLNVLGTNQQSDDHFVVVSWSANPEPNIVGYKVFRQIGSDTTLVEISGGIKNKLLITDSLSSKMEYATIKYFVVAFNDDNRRSDAATIDYNKKDTRGPISPIITNYDVVFNDVTLYWENSPDKDIKETVLLRKLMNSQDPWVVVKKVLKGENISEFLDKNLTKGETYIYTIYSTDESGNNSCFDQSKFKSTNKADACYQLVPVKIVSTKKAEFTDFKAILTIEKPKISLSWSYASNEVDSYEVYRYAALTDPLKNDVLLTSWKSFRANENVTEDLDTQYLYTYNYAIRINFKDGTVSDLRAVKVIIPDLKNCTFEQQIIHSSKMTNNLFETSCYEIILQDGFDTNKMQYKGEIKK